MFIDTGGWYALLVTSDRWHRTAAAVFDDLDQRRIPLATSNLVVGETYTLLRMTHGHALAWRFVDALARSARLQRWQVTDKAERAAWALLRKFSDQPFSFVDATSFALMSEHRANEALAFDAHFAAAGFVRLGVDGRPR